MQGYIVDNSARITVAVWVPASTLHRPSQRQTSVDAVPERSASHTIILHTVKGYNTNTISKRKKRDRERCVKGFCRMRKTKVAKKKKKKEKKQKQKKEISKDKEKSPKNRTTKHEIADGPRVVGAIAWLPIWNYSLREYIWCEGRAWIIRLSHSQRDMVISITKRVTTFSMKQQKKR